MMLVDIPTDTDGCTSYHNDGPGVKCNYEHCDWRIDGHKDLGNGIIFVDDALEDFVVTIPHQSQHYTWFSINIGGCTGCCENY